MGAEDGRLPRDVDHARTNGSNDETLKAGSYSDRIEILHVPHCLEANFLRTLLRAES